MKTSQADSEPKHPRPGMVASGCGYQAETPLPLRKSRRELGRPSLFCAWFLAAFSVLFAVIASLDDVPAALIAITLASAGGYSAIRSFFAEDAVRDLVVHPRLTSRLFIHGQFWAISERGLIVSSAHHEDPGIRTIAFEDIEQVVVETKGLYTEIRVMGVGARVFCRMLRPPFEDQSTSVDFANEIKDRSSARLVAC